MSKANIQKGQRALKDMVPGNELASTAQQDRPLVSTIGCAIEAAAAIVCPSMLRIGEIDSLNSLLEKERQVVPCLSAVGGLK